MSFRLPKPNSPQILLTFFLWFTFTITIAQVLPSNRAVDWSLSGYRGVIPSPPDELNILNFGGSGDGVTDNSTAVQNAINTLAGNPGIIVFPTGNFFFASGITLEDGVVLRGDGSESTTLTFNLGGSGHLINAEGTATATVSDFLLSTAKDDHFIIVQNASGFSVGDYIRISQNDAALVTSSWAIGTVGQIARIKTVNGNALELESELRRDYNLADNPRVQKIEVRQNVGVECLKIVRLDETNPSQTSNVRFKYAAQSWVRGVESNQCNFAHVVIDASTNITVSGCYFHHAFNYGGGGRAYGVMIQQTGNESRIENNVFEYLRHSMIVQSGANGNVFGYNYSFDPFWTGTSLPDNSAGDVVCHGNYVYANLFEGNIAQQAVIDASHGKNGPLNTFFRSRYDLYGLVMTDSFSHQQNFIGNEITNGPHDTLGLYYLLGNNHLEHGNSVRDTIVPTGTTSSFASSHYQPGTPYFFTGNFPTIGIPNPFNSGSIPAKDRVAAGGTYTECPPPNVTPLPVELIRFVGVLLENKKVRLEWETAAEINHDFFQLERSKNGIDFEWIAKIENENNSNTHHHTTYEYLDSPTESGLYYYRLSQTDQDGSVTFFPIISIEVRPNFSTTKWKIYPTVFSESITIQNEEFSLTNTSVVITDALGKKVKTFLIESNVQVLPLHQLPKGVYFLTILKNQEVLQSEKIIAF